MSGPSDTRGRPEVAVGAVVQRGSELLLVLRGRGVAAGTWSLPGGRVEFGEGLRAACAREVLEETGVAVTVGRFLGWAERVGDDPFAYHYVILDFAATPVDPQEAPVAGDDAADAAWVPVEALAQVDLAAGLREFLDRVLDVPDAPATAG